MVSGLRSTNGVAAPPFTNGPYTWDQHVTFTAGVAGATFNNKFGTKIWYVDSGITTAGDGTSPEKALATLAGAVTKAGNYDIILVAENTIETIAATITITQTGLKIFGSGSSEAAQASALKTTYAGPMFLIKADRVEIAGLRISQRSAYASIMIGDTAGQAYYQTHIHHCNFDGYGTALYGVSPGPVAAAANGQCDPVNLVVEDCYFKGIVTAAIVSNGTRDTYRRNTIHVTADSCGVYVFKTAGDRGYGVVADNLMFGEAGTTTIGIKGAGNNTAGLLIYARNLFVGDFDTTISNNTGDPGVLNYVGSTTGGSLIDCNSSA